MSFHCLSQPFTALSLPLHCPFTAFHEFHRLSPRFCWQWRAEELARLGQPELAAPRQRLFAARADALRALLREPVHGGGGGLEIDLPSLPWRMLLGCRSGCCAVRPSPWWLPSSSPR